MVTVKDLINRDVYFIKENDKVIDLLALFDEKKISCAPVVDSKNKLIGIITIADILSRIHKPLPLFDIMSYVVVLDTDAIVKGEIYDVLEKPVSELMTRKVISVGEDATFADVARLMSRYRFKKIPVVEEKKLVGVVNRGEIVRYFIKEYLQKNRKADY